MLAVELHGAGALPPLKPQTVDALLEGGFGPVGVVAGALHLPFELQGLRVPLNAEDSAFARVRPAAAQESAAHKGTDDGVVDHGRVLEGHGINLPVTTDKALVLWRLPRWSRRSGHGSCPVGRHDPNELRGDFED